MKRILLLALALGTFQSVVAQDDLLDFLGEEEESINYTSATFKDSRVINVQSNETAAKGVLRFVISHRFGRLSDGAYELFGLDNATIRLGLDYGITDRIQVGIARSSFEKTYEGNLKVKLLRQSSGGKEVPVSLTWYSGMYINGLRWEEPERENYFTSRLSYAHQLIVTRKFSKSFSLAFVPSYLHDNLVRTAEMNNDQLALGLGGRVKLTNRLSLNAEYHYRIIKRVEQDDPYNNSFSIGVDIETGGHVFQLHVTNSRGMFETAYIGETAGRWVDGDIYFGFNISRVFTVGKR
jgi:opacity protein-like surface antigen